MGGMVKNWTSKIQPSTIALQSAEAGYYSLTYGAQKIMFATITEVAEVEPHGALILQGKQEQSSSSKKVGQRKKRINIQHQFIRDLVVDGKIIALVFEIRGQ